MLMKSAVLFLSGALFASATESNEAAPFKFASHRSLQTTTTLTDCTSDRSFSSGETVVLGSDITCDCDDYEPGLKLTGGATLDLAGFTLSCNKGFNQNGIGPCVYLSGSNNVVMGGTLTMCRRGIKFAGDGGNMVDDVQIITTTYGLDFHSSSDGNIIENLIIDDYDSKGILLESDENEFSNIVIINPSTDSSTEDGIIIDGDDNIFDNVFVQGASDDGIYINGDDNVITNCISEGDSDDVEISSDASDNVVECNLVAAPTAAPSDSAEPSMGPTMEPSMSPSLSVEPTKAPTDEPSASPSLSSAPTSAMSSIPCGTVLRSDTVLDGDMTCDCSHRPALLVTSRAELDLNGYTVSCALGGSYSCIELEWKSAEVYNGMVRDCKIGIKLDSRGRHKVTDVTAMDVDYGMFVDSDDNVVTGFTVVGYQDRGIYIDDRADENVFVDIDISMPTEDKAEGIEVDGEENVFTNVVAEGNPAVDFNDDDNMITAGTCILTTHVVGGDIYVDDGDDNSIPSGCY